MFGSGLDTDKLQGSKHTWHSTHSTPTSRLQLSEPSLQSSSGPAYPHPLGSLVRSPPLLAHAGISWLGFPPSPAFALSTIQWCQSVPDSLGGFFTLLCVSAALLILGLGLVIDCAAVAVAPLPPHSALPLSTTAHTAHSLQRLKERSLIQTSSSPKLSGAGS